MDATTATATAWDPNASAQVNALDIKGSTVFVGGESRGPDAINGALARNRLAAVNATTGTATAWDPNANNDVSALAVSSGGSVVAAGGSFSSLGGQPRSNVAALDASDGTLTAWNPNANSNVNALAVQGSTVYIGGAFDGPDAINGAVEREHAAAVDATTGLVTGWDPQPSATVRALAVAGSTVYLGGDFDGADGINGSIARNGAAAVDATTGVATPWNPNVSNTVNTLALSGSTVYLGGNFTGANSINGTLERNRLAAVDATTGLASGWNPNANSNVNALSVSGSTVYIGGDFDGADAINGSVAREHAAAVDATTGVATGWDPNPKSEVFALMEQLMEQTEQNRGELKTKRNADEKSASATRAHPERSGWGPGGRRFKSCLPD